MPSYERIPADRDEITNNLHIVFSPSCDTLLLHYAKIVKLDETARTGLGKQREERKRNREREKPLRSHAQRISRA